jgi:hypothetical protein
MRRSLTITFAVRWAKLPVDASLSTGLGFSTRSACSRSIARWRILERKCRRRVCLAAAAVPPAALPAGSRFGAKRLVGLRMSNGHLLARRRGRCAKRRRYFALSSSTAFPRSPARRRTVTVGMVSTPSATITCLLRVAIALLATAPVANAQTPSRMTYELLDARVMAGTQIPGGPLSYLVTPSRRTFRILGTQPILDADGTKLGSLLAYVGDTRDPQVATSHSLELMEAWGPDAVVQGETAVLVQAQVNFDPRKKLQSTVALHVAFQLKDGKWTRLPEPPPRPDRPKTIGTGPLEVIDQPGFPFDRSGLEEAAKVVRRWLMATDAGDGRRLREEMSRDLASDVESKKAEWERSLPGRAHLKVNSQRRELYRIQTWEGEPSPKGTRLYFAYSVNLAGLGPAVEKVKLVKEEDRWRVRGYGLLIRHSQVGLLRTLMSSP